MSETGQIDNNATADNNNLEINQNVNILKDENSDVSSSGVSSASSKSGIPKQSGIRPPSRIGRPCGGIQKPAIPATPTKNSSDDSMKRLTDDYGRHRLTDLVEADESEEDTLEYLKSTVPRNRYTSTDSASSMDGLWEIHPRRLSEAGLSRHSDSSAVLTEDTDSFMIGQRVWVGGTKPGTIAYIGETQFAPGDWAGIALDEPIGKNDGSVGGTRYFQCENKKGVFSRLTRLTRVPLEQPGMGSNETFTSPNGVRRSPISPTGSTRSLLKSPVSLSTSNTSLNSSATHVDFKIGDRVIIKSTQGSKVGTVRYMGLTDFASGEWVGVELDDPRGKNDGSVEGKRYFECRPNFGLFAPIAKVSKSPSKYKPAACAVHSGGLPPSGLKRANSKESMTSMTSKTSAASSVRRVRLGVTSLTPKKVSPKTSTPLPTRTALQDVLREKQQHIEQLLKERDLERAEITRAASQADDAEQKFFGLKQEFEKYRAECETKIKENSDVLNDLKLDRDELLSQLEDEKRKNEDLQFRFEEAAITKSDVEANAHAQNVVNENYLKRISELESNLAEERQKSEILESTSNKLFEAEESLIKAREEIDSLRIELTKSRTEQTTIDHERSQILESLQKQIDNVNLENQEKSNKISQLTEEISKVKSDHEISKEQSENTCKDKDKEIEKLKAQIEEQKKIIEKHEQTQVELTKDNDKLKMQLSSINLDCENTNETLVAKEKQIKSLTDELDTVKKNLTQKLEDLERHNANAAKIEEDLHKELTQTREDLKTKISEAETIKKELTLEINKKDQQLQENNTRITQNNEEIKKLTEELASVKSSFEETKNEIHNRHTRQVASQDSQLAALTAEIQQKNDEITKSSIAIRKLEEELTAKSNNIEKLRLELETYAKQQTQQSQASLAFQSEINELSLKNGDLQRQLDSANNKVSEFMSLRQRLEAEIQSLSVKCDNAEQLEHLRMELKSKEESFANIRTEFETKLQNSERLREEFEIQYKKTINEFERLRLELETKLQVSQQSEALLQQQYELSLSKLSSDTNESTLKISELEQSLQAKELHLANLQEKLTETNRFYEEQIKTITEHLNQNLESSQEKIKTLNEETIRLNDEINAKTEKIIEIEAQASHTVAQCEQTKKELEQKFTEEIKRLEFDLNEKILALNKLTSELNLVKEDCLKNNTNLATKDHKIGELTGELQQSQDVMTQLQQQLNSLQLTQIQTKQEYVNLQNQNQELLDQVTILTNKVKISEDGFNDLKNEYNSVVMLVNRLKLTEQQKQECLQQLQQEAVLTADQKNCNHVIDLLNQIKIDSNTTSIEVMANLQKDIDVIRNQLIERNKQYDSQQQELLKLQQELLKARESQTTSATNQDPNSVRINYTDTTQHEFVIPNSLELQVELALLKNFYSGFYEKFNELYQSNVYVLTQLKQGVCGDNEAIHKTINKLLQIQSENKILNANLRYDDMRLPKFLQNLLLELQNRDGVISGQKVLIQNLLQTIRDLPTQCKLFALDFQNINFDIERVGFDIEITKMKRQIENRDYVILDLKKLISKLLVEYSQISETICLEKPCFCELHVNQEKCVLSTSSHEIVGGQVRSIPVQCHLPDLSLLVGSSSFEISLNNLNFSGFNSYDVLKFKESLKSVVDSQSSYIASTRQSQVCGNLPAFNLPQDCSSLFEVIENLILDEYNSNSCRNSLVQLLNFTQQCVREENSEKLNLKLNSLEGNCPKLPLLELPQSCQLPEDIVGNVKIEGYSLSDIENYKQSLLEMLSGVQDCGVTKRKLPLLELPQSCQLPEDIVGNVKIEGYSPSDVENYKQSLLEMLSGVQDCSVGKRKLPLLELPQSCQLPEDIVGNVKIEGYSPSDVENYKQSLLEMLSGVQDCGVTKCKLPLLELPQSCQLPEDIVGNVKIEGYSSSDIENYKHSLLEMLSGVQDCGVTKRKLPLLELPQSCQLPEDIVGNVKIEGYSPSDVENYKQSLLEMLSGVQDCSVGKRKLPLLELPQSCQLPEDIVGNVKIEGYSSSDIENYKQSLLEMLSGVQDCGVSKRKLPLLELPQSCQLPEDIVDNVKIEGYSSSDIENYKQSLLEMLSGVQDCGVSKRKLPLLELPQSCQLPEDIVGNVKIEGYSSSDVENYKQSLLEMLSGVQDCGATERKLPLLELPQSCQLPEDIVDNVKIEGYSSSDIENYKQSLLEMLSGVQDCGASKRKLPLLEIPQSCELPEDIIKNVKLEGYSSSDIEEYKQSLMKILNKLQDCVESKPQFKSLDISADSISFENIVKLNNSDSLPRLPLISSCMKPLEIINQIDLDSFPTNDSNLFSKSLLDLLKIQQTCCDNKSVKQTPQVPVLKPSEIKYEEIPARQPPKVVIKQVPVYIPQPPQIIMKEIPVDEPGNCKVTIQQVPIKVRVPVRINVPVPVYNTCRLPNVEVFDCYSPETSLRFLDLSSYNDLDAEEFKKSLVGLIKLQRDCNQRIHTKVEIPILENSQRLVTSCGLPDLSYLRGCVTSDQIQSLSIPETCSLTDIKSFKETLWNIIENQRNCKLLNNWLTAQDIRFSTSVPYGDRQQPIILVKEVPVFIPQPKIMLKQTPIIINNREYKQPNILYRDRPVLIRAPPRIIVKQVPVSVNVHQPEISSHFETEEFNNWHLPDIDISNCGDIFHQIQSLNLNNYNSQEAMIFKQNLYVIIMKQRQCVQCNSQNCELISQQIASMPLRAYSESEIREFREIVLDMIHQKIEDTLPVFSYVAKEAGSWHLPNIEISSCEDVSQEIQSLNLNNYDSNEAMIFKQNLYRLIMKQRECVECYNTNLQPCERILQEISDMPIKPYSELEIQRFKQNALYLLQQLITETTPEFNLKAVVPTKWHLPRVQITSCKDISGQIQSLNLSNYNSDEAVIFKQNLYLTILKQRECVQCYPPEIYLQSCRRILQQITFMPLRPYSELDVFEFKQNILDLLQHEIEENSPQFSFVTKESGTWHLPIVKISSCGDVSSELDSLNLNNYNDDEARIFKQSLYIMIVKQRECVKCNPLEIDLKSCDGILKQIESMSIRNYSESEVREFRQNLLDVPIEKNQGISPSFRSVDPGEPESNSECVLPDIETIQGCENLRKQIQYWNIFGYNSSQVNKFKDKLFDLLLQQRECFISTKYQPKQINVFIPQPPQVIIKEVPVFIPQQQQNIYKEIPVHVLTRTLIKEIPVPVRIPYEVKIPVPVEIPVSGFKCKLPSIPTYGCGDLQEQIQSLVLLDYETTDVLAFKNNLLISLARQRHCLVDNNYQGNCTPQYIKVPVSEEVEVPVDIIKEVKVEVPKEVNKYIRVPLEIPIPQPAKILIKEVPVYVPQAPKIIYQEKPVPRSGNPKVIHKDKIVRVFQPHVIVKEVPVKIPVPVETDCQLPEFDVNTCGDLYSCIQGLHLSGFNTDSVVNFKNKLLFLNNKHLGCNTCKLPDLRVSGCGQLENQIHNLMLQNFTSYDSEMFKQQLLSILLEQRSCSQQSRCRNQVIRIPVPVKQPIYLKEYIEVPSQVVEEKPKIINEVQVPIYHRIPVAVPVPIKQIQQIPKEIIKEIIKEVPRIIIKEVKVPVYHRVSVPVKQFVQVSVVKEIIKKVPVYIDRPVRIPVRHIITKEIIKEVKVPVKEIVEVPKEIKVPVKVFVPQPPKILIKQVPVPVLQKPRILVKQVPVPVKCDHEPNIIVREKPVHIKGSPQIIIKEVPVKMGVPTYDKTCRLPLINLDTGDDIIDQIAEMRIPGYNQSEVDNFKNNLISAFTLLLSKNNNECRLPKIEFSSCDNIQNQIKSLSLPNYSQYQIDSFKENLLLFFFNITNCLLKSDYCQGKIIKVPVDRIIKVEVPKEVIKEVAVPDYRSLDHNKPEKQIVYVPNEIIKEVPVKRIVEVPKEVIREVIKEVKVPVEVPKYIIKEIIKKVPVPVRQIIEIPKTVTKQVVVPGDSNNLRCSLPRLNIDSCKNIVEEINNLRISGYDLSEVDQFKKDLYMLLDRQSLCSSQCYLPVVNIRGCDSAEQLIDSINLSNYNQLEINQFKQQLYTLIQEQRVCGTRQNYAPNLVHQKDHDELVPDSILESPTDSLNKKILQEPQSPKIIIQQVPVVIANCSQKPTVIVKEVPVPVNVPPRVIIEQVPVQQPISESLINDMSTRDKAKDLPFDCDNLEQKIQSLGLPGYDFDQISEYKQRLLQMLLEQRHCGQLQQEPGKCSPKIVEVPVEKLVYVNGPVSVPQPQRPEVIGKRVLPSNPDDIVKQISNYTNGENNILEEVPVSVSVNTEVPFGIRVPVKAPVSVDEPVGVPVYVQVPVKVPVCIQTEDPIEKEVLIHVPVEVTKIIKEQYPDLGLKPPNPHDLTEPEFRSQEIPTNNTKDTETPQVVEKIVPKIIIQQIPVPQAPKIIEKPVYIRVPQPAKVVIQKVEVPVINGTECPPPKIIEKIVSVPQPPEVITKIIEVEVPPKILTKEVPVPYGKTVIKECPHETHSCAKLILPDADACISPENYVEQVNLESCSSDQKNLFKKNLLQVFNNLFNCGGRNNPLEQRPDVLQPEFKSANPAKKVIAKPSQFTTPLPVEEKVDTPPLYNKPLLSANKPINRTPSQINYQLSTARKVNPAPVLVSRGNYQTFKGYDKNYGLSHGRIGQFGQLKDSCGEMLSSLSDHNCISSESYVEKLFLPFCAPDELKTFKKDLLQAFNQLFICKGCNNTTQKHPHNPTQINKNYRHSVSGNKQSQQPESSCGQLIVPVVDSCISPEKYLQQINLRYCSSDDTPRFRKSLLSIFNQLFSCGGCDNAPVIVQPTSSTTTEPTTTEPTTTESTTTEPTTTEPITTTTTTTEPTTTQPTTQPTTTDFTITQPATAHSTITQPTTTILTTTEQLRQNSQQQTTDQLAENQEDTTTVESTTEQVVVDSQLKTCFEQKQGLAEKLRFQTRQTCMYKQVNQRLKLKIYQLLMPRDDNNNITQQPAVPLPMLHVMNQISPSMHVPPYQNPPTSLSLSNAEFVQNLNKAFKHTQNALSHCLEAVVKQQLTQSQIKNQCNNSTQLLQDKELAENQIKFLNSIIVDIQKKNEEQRARIEILEAGCSPAFADEMKSIGQGDRTVAPRMYCDICEEFDLHETEDCPQQNTDIVVPDGDRGNRTVTNRPYCEICEAFGHATEDCQEDQTF